MLIETSTHIQDIRIHTDGEKYVVGYSKKEGDTAEFTIKKKQMLEVAHAVHARGLSGDKNASAPCPDYGFTEEDRCKAQKKEDMQAEVLRKAHAEAKE